MDKKTCVCVCVFTPLNFQVLVIEFENLFYKSYLFVVNFIHIYNAFWVLSPIPSLVSLPPQDCTTVDKSTTKTKYAEEIGKLQNQGNEGQHAEDQHLALELMFRRLKLDPALLTQMSVSG